MALKAKKGKKAVIKIQKYHETLKKVIKLSNEIPQNALK